MSEVTKDICAVYGEDAMAERTAKDWFAGFKRGNFDLNDAPRSGRPIKMNEDQLRDCGHRFHDVEQGFEQQWKAAYLSVFG